VLIEPDEISAMEKTLEQAVRLPTIAAAPRSQRESDALVSNLL